MGYGYGNFGGFGGGLGGFGGGAPWCPRPVVQPVVAPAPANNGFALIVVLFILLIIVGAAACA